MKRILASLLGMYAFCVLTPADSAQQLILRPDATVSTLNLYRYPDSGGYVDKIWDRATDNDATYIYATGSYYGIGRFSFPDHTTQVGIINSVTAYWRYRGTATGGETQLEFNVSGAFFAGPTRTLNTYWTTWSVTRDERPGGGSWTWDDIDALELRVYLSSPSSGTQARCTQAYVVVDYTPPTPTPTVTPTATQTPTQTPTPTPTPCHDYLPDGFLGNTPLLSPQSSVDQGWKITLRDVGPISALNSIVYDKENVMSGTLAPPQGPLCIVIERINEDIFITSPYILTLDDGRKIYLPDLPPAP